MAVLTCSAFPAPQFRSPPTQMALAGGQPVDPTRSLRNPHLARTLDRNLCPSLTVFPAWIGLFSSSTPGTWLCHDFISVGRAFRRPSELGGQTVAPGAACTVDRPRVGPSVGWLRGGDRVPTDAAANPTPIGLKLKEGSRLIDEGKTSPLAVASGFSLDLHFAPTGWLRLSDSPGVSFYSPFRVFRPLNPFSHPNYSPDFASFPVRFNSGFRLSSFASFLIPFLRLLKDVASQ